MLRHLLAALTAMSFLFFLGCSGALNVSDDDDTYNEDDDDVSDDDDDNDDDDDDATDDDDDDDDVTDDDDDDDVTDDDDDDDVTDDDDDDAEPCCSDAEYPAYYVDSLEITTFLESTTYNDFLNVLLMDALPPTSDSVIILFDPDEDLVGDTSFQARFGIGEVTQDLYSFSTSPTPVNWDYSQDAQRHFATVDSGLLLNLSFGVTVPLHDAEIAGQFAADYSTISVGLISGGIHEDDTVGIKTSFGDLHDLMDDRELDVDTDGDGTLDGWSFEMAFTGVQFL